MNICTSRRLIVPSGPVTCSGSEVNWHSRFGVDSVPLEWLAANPVTVVMPWVTFTVIILPRRWKRDVTDDLAAALFLQEQIVEERGCVC